MARILPAIIPQSIEDLREKLETVRGLAEWVQIDLVDGLFAPPLTWPYSGGSPKDLAPLLRDINAELHLMVQVPESRIHEWLGTGVRRIYAHYESTAELGVVADAIRSAGIEFGVALKLETPVEVIDPWIDRADAVLCLSIAEIGYQGHPFDESVVPKIEGLRARYPEITIGVDGGVTIPVALRLAELGVENIVVGGGIFNAPNPRHALSEFNEALGVLTQ